MVNNNLENFKCDKTKSVNNSNKGAAVIDRELHDINE